MDLSLPFSSDAEIEEIGLGVIDRSLPKRRWTHSAHFAFALWMLHARSELDASVAIPPAIRAYNVATGVANTDSGGYHETITLASIAAARAFARGRSDALFETCNALMASPLGKPDWLMTYWSRDVLCSVAGRRTWCEPDLTPFPYHPEQVDGVCQDVGTGLC